MTSQPIHHAAHMYADEYKAGKLSRREFLTRTTAFGVTTVAAYGLIGLNAPAQAAGHIQSGGTLRVQLIVKALKDPRTWDWTEMANVARGHLEYLVEYNNDGSFTGMLLESWEANEDATQYTLNVRPGVKFADTELIGIPHRVVVSERGLAAGELEYQHRRDAESRDLKRAAVLDLLEQ